MCFYLKNPKKLRKSFFPTKFKEYIWQGRKGVFINAMNLYNDRNKNIKLFEYQNIMPFNYALDAKSELEEYDGVEKSEQKFDRSIGKRVKLRRQKSDELNKMITDKEDNEQLDTADMPDLESEESAKQRIKQRTQG